LSTGQAPANEIATVHTSDLAVVTDADENASKLTVVEAAEVAQVSPSTIIRAISKGILPARRRGKGFTIMRDVVIQVAPQLRERAPSRRAEETRAAGEIAAEAFAAFERGEPLVSVVQRLRLDPRVVEDLWDRWIGLQKKQRESVALRCLHHGTDCRGSLLPYTAVCDHHAARSRVLTREQEAVLRGQEIPIAVTCTSCGKTAGRGLCASCTTSLAVAVEGEGPGRRIVVRAHGEVVAIVGAKPSRELAHQLLKEADPITTERETT
jgi:hypothetical protein